MNKNATLQDNRKPVEASEVNCTPGAVKVGGPPSSMRYRLAGKQAGFGMMDLGLWLLVVSVLTVVLVPRVGSYLIESRVPKTAESIIKFITTSMVQVQGTGAAPYTDFNTSMLANSLRGDPVFTVTGSGAGATVTHDLGSAGATLTAGPATIVSAGDALQVTFNGVSVDACVPLATSLQGAVKSISINGTAVKETIGSVTGQYKPVLARSSCVEGETNVLIFTSR